MTICNMSVEGGARAGLVAPDDTTFAYLEGRPGVQGDFDAAVERWRAYRTDDDAAFDREIVVDVPSLAPQVSWGTNPGQTAAITSRVPEPTTPDEERALAYMALEAGTPLEGIAIDRVFIGSCTNSRLEDLRAAARGRARASASRAACGRWWCRARCRSRPRRRPRGSTASSAPPASSGATPAAPCASA